MWEKPERRATARPAHDEVLVAALTQRALAGDRDAFGRLCDEYHLELLRFGTRRLPTLEDAEDLVQQTYFRAFRAAGGLDPDRPFNAWLFHIARNLVRDFYRTRRATTALEPETMGEREASAEARVVDDLLDPRLEDALACLTARQRWVVRMRIFEDLDYEEIARRLGSSPGAVRAVQMRAMHALREELGVAVAALRSA